MIAETYFDSNPRWPLHAVVIGFLSFLVLCGMPGGANQAQAQAIASTTAVTDQEFLEQMEEVERQFPLVARALHFQQTVARFCNVDPICFTRVQDVCLGSQLPPRYCLAQAQEACCMAPVLAPISR